jgi:hypothetical protein
MTGNNPRGLPSQAVRITGGSTARAASALGAAVRDSSLRAVPAAFYGRTARAAGTGDSQPGQPTAGLRRRSSGSR